jgi:PAS domain S-box-containing protein
MDPPPQSQDRPAWLDAVVRANELNRRASRPPNYAAENEAFLALAQELADSPRTVLRKLADTALALCRAQSAGVSLLEEENGRHVCRWLAASGRWSTLAGTSLPRESAPCSVAVSQDSTLLLREPSRLFTALAAIDPPAFEIVLAPFKVRGENIGSIWAVSHEAGRTFDAEDARALESLARFTSVAHRISATLDALRESEERFRIMADSSPFMIWVTDPGGNIQFINHAYMAFFGVTPEQVQHQGWQVLVHPEDCEDYFASFLESLRKRQPWTRQVRVKRADGQWRWIQSSSVPWFSAGGELLGAVGSSPDITDQKRYGEELEALVAQRSEELDRTHQALRRTETMAVVGALAGGIAHDLGNLLMPLRTRVEELMQLTLPEEGRKHLAAIEDTAEYLRELSNRLRAYMRGGAAEAGAEPVVLDRWCHEVEQFFRSVVPEGIALQCEVGPGLPPIAANKAALTQAVYNLVQNAVQAIVDAGSGGVIRLRAEEGKDRLRMIVEDDGPGMPPEVRARCFEPFYSGRTSTGGMGVGLSLVRGFAESVGGTLDIQSPVPGTDRGTAFVLSIPTSPRRRPNGIELEPRIETFSRGGPQAPRRSS